MWIEYVSNEVSQHVVVKENPAARMLLNAPREQIFFALITGAGKEVSQRVAALGSRAVALHRGAAIKRPTPSAASMEYVGLSHSRSAVPKGRRAAQILLNARRGRTSNVSIDSARQSTREAALQT